MEVPADSAKAAFIRKHDAPGRIGLRRLVHGINELLNTPVEVLC